MHLRFFVARRRPCTIGENDRARGLQARAHNCGPHLENCGPAAKNLAVAVSECYFQVHIPGGAWRIRIGAPLPARQM